MNRFSSDELNEFDDHFNSDATPAKVPRPELFGPVSTDAQMVKVHVLSEFVYCRRAGQIAFEQPVEDSGDECLAPRLDYLPNYDQQLIRDAMERIRRPLTNLVLWSVPSFAIWLVLLQVHFATGVIIAVGLFGFVGPVVWRMVRAYFILRRRLHEAAIAPAIGIKFDVPIEQSINWWGLIKAGFESIEMREPLRDPRLNLKGKPWRVLQFGSHRIPVIRKQNDERLLYPQHRVRLAAYAYLIETCEAANVPFGIVLFGDSNDGIAIPISAEMKQHVQKLLGDLRRQLNAVAFEPFIPAPPESGERCRNCPYAAHRRFVEGQSESLFVGQPAKPYLVQIGNGPAVHCDCGDRFGWKPPL